MKMRYYTPSNWNWNRALPIGNGRLGGMFFGENEIEHIQVNEDSIWGNSYHNRVNPNAKDNLQKIRELIFAGKIPDAERLMKLSLTAVPESQAFYQTAGNVYINLIKEQGKAQVIERGLDLDNAVAYVISDDGKTKYYRECLASFNNQILAFKYVSDEKVSVDCSYNNSPVRTDISQDENTLYYHGKSMDDAVEYVVGLRCVCDGANADVMSNHIICEDADSITVYVSIETSFYCENPFEKVKERLNEAEHKGYEKIKEEHIKDYSNLADACSLTLGEMDEKPNKYENIEYLFENLNSENGNKKIESINQLINTYFRFGRYLLISSSRPGFLPANLQGIWNNDFTPPWGSKFTININAQMNYWPAERLNLSSLHEPLFAHMKRMETHGREVASNMYGCGGIVAHHNTDIWGDCAPQDTYNPATYWPMGFAWLCTHIWDHYEYTGDEEFLKDMYEIIKESTQFFIDYLVEYNGKLVTCPSVSPENTYILPDGTKGCNGFGCTMDNEILRDLFKINIRSAKILGEDKEYIEKLEAVLSKLPEVKIGSKGQILEWFNEYDEAEKGHRHISHLYGLFPSSQFSFDETPKLMDAARKSLEDRLVHGGGHTGWSRAWIIAMFARLRDGANAYKNLVALLEKSTLPNLFDNHPPFQIDGNFGSIAAISEMLIQSHRDILNEDEERVVYILPAIPDEWKSGSVKGLVVRGGAIFDFSWKDGKVISLKVKANKKYKALVRVNDKEMALNLDDLEEFKLI